MKIIVTSDRTDALIDALTTLWEASVRATHHFLTEEDIQKLIPFVKMGVSGIETFIVAYDEQKLIAFMGVESGKMVLSRVK